jgi:hypothetical protein
MSLLKKFKTKAIVPDLKLYVGRVLTIPGEPKPIMIETVQGNLGMSLGHENARPTFYEINGKYLIGMLRFHAQMCGDHSITEQQFLDFENMEMSAKKMDPKEKKES